MTARKPGRVVMHGRVFRLAECADCGRRRPLPFRGLCFSCAKRNERAGTLNEFGWTRADRLGEYRELRQGGLSIAAAAIRTGVSRRTADRYEADLRLERAA